jgi:hypothetical protein
MTDYEKERMELRDLCIPIIYWMNKNWHPHTKLIIDCNGYEFVEGLLAMQMRTDEDDTSHI